MDTDDELVEEELIRAALRAEVEVVAHETQPGTPGSEACRIQLRLVGDRTSATVFPLLYLLAVLSFGEAPSSTGVRDDDDALTAADLLRCLTYEDGVLRFRASHVRGRHIATSIEVSPDGHMVLETHGRGSEALQWTSRVLGRRWSSHG